MFVPRAGKTVFNQSTLVWMILVSPRTAAAKPKKQNMNRTKRKHCPLSTSYTHTYSSARIYARTHTHAKHTHMQAHIHTHTHSCQACPQMKTIHNAWRVSQVDSGHGPHHCINAELTIMRFCFFYNPLDFKAINSTFTHALSLFLSLPAPLPFL